MEFPEARSRKPRKAGLNCSPAPVYSYLGFPLLKGAVAWHAKDVQWNCEVQTFRVYSGTPHFSQPL